MTVTINGVRYEGDNLSIVNGVMLIDGKPINPEDEGNQVKIVLEGVTDVYSDQSISIKGNVAGNVTAHGNVNCDDVHGNAMSDNNVNCDEVKGNVMAGGNVNCDNVYGSVDAKGRVNCDTIHNRH